MIMLELAAALLFALLFAGILLLPLRRRGPGPMHGLLYFFLILFLAIWAGGVWVTPVGPPAWGVPWMGFLAVGVILALLLAAMSPREPGVGRPPGEADRVAPTVVATLGVFFYILLLGLLVIALLRYMVG